MSESRSGLSWFRARPAVVPEAETDPAQAGLADLLSRVARGDQEAFEQVYDRIAGPVYGTVLRVMRDPAQSEEVVQEVLVQVWQQASRYDPAKGSALGWTMTLAHRRAVDRVRSAQAAADRELRSMRFDRERDEVSEDVEDRMEQERVKRCVAGLTELQRESINLAYYSGYTYREVADLLQVSLGTVKTRMRDGLIRMRDCLGVER